VNRMTLAVILLVLGVGLMAFAVVQHLRIVEIRVSHLALYLAIVAVLALAGAVASVLMKDKAAAPAK